MTALLAARCFSLTALGWTAAPRSLGAGIFERCNCIFETANFFFKLCHYVGNVHAYSFFEILHIKSAPRL